MKSLLAYAGHHRLENIQDLLVRSPFSSETIQARLTSRIALIYHAGGLIAGSSEIVPQAEIEYLCSRGFVAVLPNYRLVPQVSGRESFKDCEDAFDWAIGDLPGFSLKRIAWSSISGMWSDWATHRAERWCCISRA